MTKSISIIKINPKSGLGGRTSPKLKPGLDWPQTSTVDKMQLKLDEEHVMIWISLHGLTLLDVGYLPKQKF